MTYGREEIEAIQKRLEAVEEAINDLKAEDLLIAKMIGQALCTTTFNIFLSVQRAKEDIDKYTKLWRKKLDDINDEIAASPTAKKALDMSYKFYEELAEYVKARKVGTAEEAMDIAHTFIKKYSPVALPMKAVREDDVWLVDIDVGALTVKIAKVKVDAKTGDILSYEIPEK